MYELEVAYDSQSALAFSEDVARAFVAGQLLIDSFNKVSVLQWEEHCIECAMPACYKTCDLYEARSDGKCRRFAKGIVPQPIPGRENLVVRIDFKRWGALMATNHVGVLEPVEAAHLEQKAWWAGEVARHIPVSSISVLGRRGLQSRLATRYKNRLSRLAAGAIKKNDRQDGFLIEVYNPGDEEADLSFVIRAKEGPRNTQPYQYRLKLSPGYHSIEIPYDEIEPHIDPSRAHFISFIPNNLSRSSAGGVLSLYFGFLGFYQKGEGGQLGTTVRQQGNKLKSVKVIVWDLDNTLWDGILVEDGEERIAIKSGVTEIIKELDQRGIVSSIASKNDYASAWRQIERLGLSEYFLFPQISWNPKSQSIQQIIQDFNVGANTIAFIDDSEFERSEVTSVISEVRTIDALEYRFLLDRPEFNPEVSSESFRRREFYRNQERRSKASSSNKGGYLQFVRSCAIRLSIEEVSQDKLERIHELVQRTNQMNFSGNCYTKSEILQFINNDSHLALALSASDKFGDYGTVGFGLLNIENNTLVDLMFSCRIQSKRVEHAFFNWLLQRSHEHGIGALWARFRPTECNKASGKVFDDLGFEAVPDDECHTVIYRKSTVEAAPDEGLIYIDASLV